MRGTLGGVIKLAMRRRSSTKPRAVSPACSRRAENFIAHEHVEQFGKQGFAGVELKALRLRRIDQLSRRSLADDAGDQRIGIENDTHSSGVAQGAPLPPGGLHLGLDVLHG